MITVEQHLKNNAERIEIEAQQYAKSFGCSIDKARLDVADEYKSAYAEEMDDRRYHGSDGE